MKVFYSLLLVGLFAYCKGTNPHYDDCDDIAVNLAITDEEVNNKNQEHRVGADKNNQYIKVEDYLNGINGTRWIARATGLDGRNDFKLCTTVTHGSGCGPIMYENILLKKPNPNPATGNYKDVPLENNVVIQTNTYSLHVKSGTLFAVAMRAKLVNRDDLIFQADKFVGFKLNESKTEVEKIDNDDEIYKKLLAAIGQKFAVTRTEKEFSVSFTCEQEYAWGAYNNELVVEQKEGKVARAMDQVLYNLDSTNNEEMDENDYDFDKVKPVSTVIHKDGLELLQEAIKTHVDFKNDL